MKSHWISLLIPQEMTFLNYIPTEQGDKALITELNCHWMWLPQCGTSNVPSAAREWLPRPCEGELGSVPPITIQDSESWIVFLETKMIDILSFISHFNYKSIKNLTKDTWLHSTEYARDFCLFFKAPIPCGLNSYYFHFLWKWGFVLVGEKSRILLNHCSTETYTAYLENPHSHTVCLSFQVKILTLQTLLVLKPNSPKTGSLTIFEVR